MTNIFKSIMCALNRHEWGLRFRGLPPAIGKQEEYCVNCGVAGSLTGVTMQGFK